MLGRANAPVGGVTMSSAVIIFNYRKSRFNRAITVVSSLALWSSANPRKYFRLHEVELQCLSIPYNIMKTWKTKGEIEKCRVQQWHCFKQFHSAFCPTSFTSSQSCFTWFAPPVWTFVGSSRAFKSFRGFRKPADGWRGLSFLLGQLLKELQVLFLGNPQACKLTSRVSFMYPCFMFFWPTLNAYFHYFIARGFYWHVNFLLENRTYPSSAQFSLEFKYRSRRFFSVTNFCIAI